MMYDVLQKIMSVEWTWKSVEVHR